MTNFSANRVILVLCLFSLSGYGCAIGPVKSKGPPLQVVFLSPDKPAPHAAEMATVRWKSEATGGVGKHTFEFRLDDGTEEKSVQSGTSPLWDWKPTEAGTYRVKVVVRDSIGNTVDGGWSPGYVIAPRLVLRLLLPDKPAPQAAEMVTVRWISEATGGVGKHTFEFRLDDGKAEKSVQSGTSPLWGWKPTEAGTYRVKVVVRDSIGNTVDGGWSPGYVIAPKLVLRSFPPDKPAPQAAEMAAVRWKSEATGGVGKHTFEFRLDDGTVEKSVQSGPSPKWDWKPTEAGTYRVKVVVRDALGNTVDGGWSPGYDIVPKLAVSSLSPDSPAPQAAMISSIRWTADVVGGVGGRTYDFWILEGKKEKKVQTGTKASWEWMPRKRGTYRFKVIVHDSLGNTADSDWSLDFLIGSPLTKDSHIAVMPAENLTGMAVPLKDLRKSLMEAMKSKGIKTLEEDALEKLMEKHRVRYTGGINKELGDVFRKEAGINAVLFMSLNQYDDAYPPKIALTSRLVSTGENPSILWAESVEMAGNDAPGILGIGLIHDPRILWEKAKDSILGSMMDFLMARDPGGLQDADKVNRAREADSARFRPKNFYGTPPKPPAGRETVTIAVLPFLNDSTRRNAGEIMANIFVKRLSDIINIEVIEPGVVRQSLLMSRTIMEGGLSLPQADLLLVMLNVDLVLTGIINDYKDYSGPWGAPEVDYSTRIFDMRKRQVVWTSNSQNRGDDSVYFFNIGKVNTAHRVASEMAREVVGSMVEGRVQDQ